MKVKVFEEVICVSCGKEFLVDLDELDFEGFELCPACYVEVMINPVFVSTVCDAWKSYE
jgi:formylmethanofuran dehydrogenase subunit E